MATDDEMIAELEDVAADLRDVERHLEDLGERREDLVRLLMGTSVPRKRIAEAAGLSEPRLYQIRDGRR